MPLPVTVALAAFVVMFAVGVVAYLIEKSTAKHE